MLYLLPGVEYQGVANELWYALGFAGGVRYQMFGRDTIITSLREGTHKRQSLHDDGLAGDLRTVDLTIEETWQWCRAIHKPLNAIGCDVIQEEVDDAVIAELLKRPETPAGMVMKSKHRHLHVEFQPKIGEQFVHFLPRPK